MKTQAVRLVDVFALGPFMVYAACKEKLSTPERITLGLAGLATMLYNGKNFLEAQAKAAPIPAQIVEPGQ